MFFLRKNINSVTPLVDFEVIMSCVPAFIEELSQSVCVCNFGFWE
jgi:hypothetical protein